ncbi:MAG TPA: type II toxin-antitoxin system VapC family toxin [Propionibacteriaceae bacterium]|nr:type II toxin-antitoxin system VapC family toxin [Propionibacteriaceae bacterium]
MIFGSPPKRSSPESPISGIWPPTCSRPKRHHCPTTAEPSLVRTLDWRRYLAVAQVEFAEVTESQARIARTVYRNFRKATGHPAGLNFGDCFAFALAIERDEPLLCKGDDFKHTDIRSALSA